MNIETTQLRKLIQAEYKKFGYTPDDKIIEDTLNQTIEVLKNINPVSINNIIEEICLAKSCAAKSEVACNYFTKKYLKTIKESLQYKIKQLELGVELGDRVNDVITYVIQCLLYGKDTCKRCPPSYTLEKFDRKKSSLETFIKNIINPPKGKGIIGIYMYEERIWLTERESKVISFEEYMNKMNKKPLPPQTKKILHMSKEEIERAVDRLFELCRPEDLEIVMGLAAMYEVREISHKMVEDQDFKTKYMVSFIEKNGNKRMIVKNGTDTEFFYREETKFHICFVLGFQLKYDGMGWMIKEEIFDRMFEEKESLKNPFNDVDKIITEIRKDLSQAKFNEDMIEKIENESGVEFRLSTRPSFVTFEAENRYLRLWLFYRSGGIYEKKKEEIRIMKKRCFDRLREIGGKEFYELFR